MRTVESVNQQLDEVDVVRYIRNLAVIGASSHSDPFTQCHCKQQLFMLKSLIEDLYLGLPEFPEQEKQWEQKRLVDILQRK